MDGARAVVATKFGAVRGVERDGIWNFLGLHYAAPPVGALRFRLPRPPDPWSGVRDAVEYGPLAPQPAAGAGYIPNDPVASDEDCCTLNVYTPACDGERRPVMVFLHGGAFLGGTGSSTMYRGLALVRRGVVLVTVEYRLGALGFLAHPNLYDEDSGGFGNWGLWDQLAALAWVRDHIEGFGGDPARVTLFGESAGAMSAADLLGAPAASGLFHRAILQSGAALAAFPPAASSVAAQLAGVLGLPEPTREGFSAVPADDLLAAQDEVSSTIDRGRGQPFQPVVDGGLFARHPSVAIAAGQSAAVDVVAGTNRDEFRFFSFSVPDLADLDEAAVARIIGAYLAGSGLSSSRLPAGEIVAAYRTARSARGADIAPRELLEAIASDWLFRLPATRLLDAHRSVGGRAWSYLFDWESPFAGGALRSCHGLELPFVFGTFSHPVIGLFSGAGEDAALLADAMTGSWTAFAATGDPSCEELGSWPQYAPPRRATMVLGARRGVEDAPFEGERRFLDERLGRYGVSGPIEAAEPQSVALLLEVGASPEAAIARPGGPGALPDGSAPGGATGGSASGT